MTNRKIRICTKEFKEQMLKAYEGCKFNKYVKKTNFTEDDELIRLREENQRLKEQINLLRKKK